MVTRRVLLKTAGAGALLARVPGLTFAKAATDRRFVLVILRGAADGLAIAAPYGDPDYRRLRGPLALPEPDRGGGVLALDGMFGLHPALEITHDEFRQGRALIVHAVASPYRDRSHFDGQDVLENGAAGVGRLRDGWLNRALSPLGGSLGNEAAIAIAQNTPLVLRGKYPVTSWAPSPLPDADESTVQRLQDLYAGDDFFAARLAQALKSREIAATEGMDAAGRPGNDAERLRSTADAAARFLSTGSGPRIAVIETDGWDTHANQGVSTGTLVNRLRALDAALGALRDGLGEAWGEAVVAVVTEFGRTVRPNGTQGTDHGTASAALLAGGAIDGGRVLADWPGLGPGNLYEDRDLRPTADLRGLFKAILRDHLGLAPEFVEREVFPDSAAAPTMGGLIRA